MLCTDPGADPGLQVRGGGGGGAHLRKLRRAGGGGGTKIVGVFRVKNHDFTPILRVCAPGAPPPGSAPEIYMSLFVNQ